MILEDFFQDFPVPPLVGTGRARGPEYVRTVVSCYNEALNAIVDGTYGQRGADSAVGRAPEPRV